MMNTINFLNEIKDILEIEDESFNENSQINFTSLATLSIIVFIDENFNKQIKAGDLKNVNTPKHLMDLIGMDQFDH